MNEYFEGAIRQLQARARHLIGLIPRGLERDIDALALRCRDRIDEAILELENLLTNPSMQRPENQAIRIRRFRRVLDELDLLESVPIAALHRWGDPDRRMNRLTHQIAREIYFPLATPVVACSAAWGDYYITYPHLNFMCVPLAEHQFLLHLPDLYHELGHLLLSATNDPRLELFQQAYAEALSTIYGHLAREMQSENRNTQGPQAYKQYLATWLGCWESWLVELFCDLFAVYTVGPAFGWGHFHLCAGRGGNPVAVPKLARTEHPADAARMSVILLALERLGFFEEAARIKSWWDRLMDTVDAVETAEYLRCFPANLLETVVEKTFSGTQAIGCQLAYPDMQEPIRRLLNDAWTQFWHSPIDYVNWEKLVADSLEERLK